MTVRLAVRVIPNAKQSLVMGFLADGTLRIKIAAPAVDGKANTTLIKFLASILSVPSSSIDIISGHTTKTKILSLPFSSFEDIKKVLSPTLF